VIGSAQKQKSVSNGSGDGGSAPGAVSSVGGSDSYVGGALGAAREADGLGADRDEPIVPCGYRSRGTQDGHYDSASRDRMDSELDYDSLGDMIRRSEMVRSAVMHGESLAPFSSGDVQYYCCMMSSVIAGAGCMIRTDESRVLLLAGVWQHASITKTRAPRDARFLFVLPCLGLHAPPCPVGQKPAEFPCLQGG